jgi:hypothetical protein
LIEYKEKGEVRRRVMIRKENRVAVSSNVKLWRGGVDGVTCWWTIVINTNLHNTYLSLSLSLSQNKHSKQNKVPIGMLALSTNFTTSFHSLTKLTLTTTTTTTNTVVSVGKMFAEENGLKGDPRLQHISQSIRVVPHFPKNGFFFIYFILI